MKKIVLRSKPSLWAALLLLTFACQASHVHGSQESNIAQPPVEQEQQGSFLGPQSKQAKGEQRIIMVAVQFPDIKPSLSLDHIKQRALTRLSDYVKTQSYGQTWIKPHFMGWVSLPDPLSEYRVSPDNFKVDRGRVRKLIEDTMTAVEKQVDFSRYDHMLIIPGAFTLPGKGYGMACYCANPGMLTGVRGFPRYVTLRSKGGREFSGGISVGAENAHLGMFAHDLLHAFGGVYADKRLVP